MNKVKYFLIALFSVLSMACSNKEQFYGDVSNIETSIMNEDGEYAILFGGQRRVKGNAVSTYTNFDAFSANGIDTVMNPFTVVNAGQSWVYEGQNSQELKYFNKNAANYNFIGIMPTGISAATYVNDSLTNVTVTGLTSFTGLDGVAYAEEFLFAKDSVKNAEFRNGVTMDFKHGNAKVFIGFKSTLAGLEILDFIPGTSVSSFDIIQGCNNKLASGHSDICSTTHVANAKPGFAQIKVYDTNTQNGLDEIVAIKDLVNAQYDYFDDAAGTTPYSGTAWGKEAGKTNNDACVTSYYRLKSNASDAWVDNFNATNCPTIFNTTNMFVQQSTNAFKALIENPDSFRVVRVDVSGDGILRVWFDARATVEHTTATGTPGVDDIILLPATSILNDGSDAVLSSWSKTANVNVDMSAANVYTETSSFSSAKFNAPGVLATAGQVYWSDSVLYTFPKSIQDGMTVKFTYKYNTVTVKDARVFIPKEYCVWEEGKEYRYIINIKSVNDYNYNQDVNDPVVSNKYPITFVVNTGNYINGGEWTFDLD